VAYARSDTATASTPALGLLEGSNDGTGKPFPEVPIIRDFANPHLELLRLLREAAEVEHMLMVQYLYAGFSLKPRYQALIGEGDANASSFLGVAIQEMQHLSSVNRLLMALGGAPHFRRQSFPYESHIYPFPFTLESVSQHSLAKYVYTEAMVEAVDLRQAKNPKNREFNVQLYRALGRGARPNHVGSLYDTIIGLLRELVASRQQPVLDIVPWVAELERINHQGEEDHFEFFKSVFAGTHEVFAGQPYPWARATSDPAYPAYSLPSNPTAYVGHPGQIEAPGMLKLAWLGNMQYWIVLNLLYHGYRYDTPVAVDLAKMHMIGPLLSLMRHLPKQGCGMPFDQLSTGYDPGRTSQTNLEYIVRFLHESDRLARALAKLLPQDYPIDIDTQSIDYIHSDLAAR
jgi:hypothetical protein